MWVPDLTEYFAMSMKSDKTDFGARWRLPARHIEALVAALRSASPTTRVTAEQRVVIREICRAPERGHYAPEDFLIAFKLAIVEAANSARIAPSPERNDLIAALVSVYIDEFYLASSVSTGTPSQDRQEIAPGH
jgi:hypothetical protein